jgi:hypothetical protein
VRTSFHHQSEAQPPNGTLTAATSPDTPSHMPSHAVSLWAMFRVTGSCRDPHPPCRHAQKTHQRTPWSHCGALDNIGGETPLVVTTARDLALRRATLTERRQRAGPRARAPSASRWSFRQPHRTTTVRPCRRPEIRTRRDGRRLPEVLPRGPRAPCSARPAERCCRRRNDLLGERLYIIF